MHRLGCLRTDCRDETDKNFSGTVHRPTGAESIAQKVEVLFWIIASSISILAINDLGLLRIEFQLAFRKPLLKLVQQLASLILTAAVDDRIVRITLEWTCRKLALHPHIERV